MINDSTSATPYIRYQQVQFDHCVGIGWLATCNYDYPWIRLTMNTNGTYKVEGGQ